MGALRLLLLPLFVAAVHAKTLTNIMSTLRFNCLGLPKWPRIGDPVKGMACSSTVAYQSWEIDSDGRPHIREFCLGPKDGAKTPGTTISVVLCDRDEDQRFVYKNFRISHPSSGLCLEQFISRGTELRLVVCDNYQPGQVWLMTSKKG